MALTPSPQLRDGSPGPQARGGRNPISQGLPAPGRSGTHVQPSPNPLLLPSSRTAPVLPQRSLAWEHGQRRVTAQWPLHPPAQPLLTGVTDHRAGSPGRPQRKHQGCGGCVSVSTRHAGLPADVEGALGPPRCSPPSCDLTPRGKQRDVPDVASWLARRPPCPLPPPTNSRPPPDTSLSSIPSPLSLVTALEPPHHAPGVSAASQRGRVIDFHPSEVPSWGCASSRSP